MAPASSNNASMPSGNPFNGNDFYNNLFSDLSPLLALFGEQVTKQYMSQSIYWTGDILLSILPLGIITIVVSAIRVRGSEGMRALVGRALEPRADAALELLPSTSSEVREPWDGKRIVRLKGLSKTEAFFVCQVNEEDDFLSLEPLNCYDKEGGKSPNLMPNVPGAMRPLSERISLALLSLLVQILVLFYAIFSSTSKHWSNVDNRASTYGMPSFVAGTLSELAGLLLCSYWIRKAVHTDFIKPWILGSTNQWLFSICISTRVSNIGPNISSHCYSDAEPPTTFHK